MSTKKSESKKKSFHGGDALLAALREEGCKYVFGIPGGEFITFLEALDRREQDVGDMHYIGVRHEQAAANMADAYARVSGEVGVCCGTVGPGFLDLVPGVAPAYFDNVPMLVIHPQMDRKFDDHNRLQQGLDQLAVMRPMVKYQKHIQDPNRIIWGAQKCFKELMGGCPKPVQLEIREDAFHAQVDDYGQQTLKPSQYRCVKPPAGNSQLIEDAVKLLKTAEKPLIISGGGVTSSNGWDIIRKISLEFEIPAATTIMGIGTINPTHKTYIGATLGCMAVLQAAQQADVVLAFGTKFGFSLGYGKAPIWNRNGKLIQVDIDPQMIGKNRPVEIGILGDCRVVAEQIYNELKNKNVAQFPAEWVQEGSKTRQSTIKRAMRKMKSDKTPIHPLRLIHDVTAFMNSDDILVTDAGDITAMTTTHVDYVKARKPRTFLNSVGFGHLGVGIPYCIGAKLAKPNVNVFQITGDGSFLFNIQELNTAMNYGIPFVTIVADNCSWGMIKNMEKRTFRRRESFCVDFPDNNYAKIAEGFGCYAEKIDSPDEITPALQRALDSKKPAVLHVPIKFVAPAGAKMLASMRSIKF